MIFLPVENTVAVGAPDYFLTDFYLVKKLGGNVHVTSHTAAVLHRNYGELGTFLLYSVIEVKNSFFYL